MGCCRCYGRRDSTDSLLQVLEIKIDKVERDLTLRRLYGDKYKPLNQSTEKKFIDQEG